MYVCATTKTLSSGYYSKAFNSTKSLWMKYLDYPHFCFRNSTIAYNRGSTINNRHTWNIIVSIIVSYAYNNYSLFTDVKCSKTKALHQLCICKCLIFNQLKREKIRYQR